MSKISSSKLDLPSEFILEKGKDLPPEIVLNLILVNEGGREAYLYETANFPELSIKTVQDLFSDHFQFTLENDAAQRYLITKKNVIPSLGGEDYEEQLGKILGFGCPGAFEKKKTELTYSISYIVESFEKRKKPTQTQITAEVCDKKNAGEIQKVALWNKIFSKYNYKVYFIIEEEIPDSMFFDAVAKKDSKFLSKNWDNFVKWASGGFLFMWQSRLKRTSKDQVKSFVKDPAFLLLQGDTKLDQNAVFQSYYPLNNDEFKIDSDVKKQLIKKYISKIRTAKDKPTIVQNYQRDYITMFFSQVIKEPKDLDKTLQSLNL